MELKFSLRENPKPSRKSRDAHSLRNGSPSSDMLRKANGKQRRLSPKAEGTPEGFAAKISTTGPSRENTRLAQARHADSPQIEFSFADTPLQIPPLPFSPFSLSMMADQSPNSASKPRESFSRERLVYLDGTHSFVDMTSVPGKDKLRLVIWLIQQLSHFIELDKSLSAEGATSSEPVEPAQNRAFGIDTQSTRVHQASGPTLPKTSTAELGKSPSSTMEKKPLTESAPVVGSRREGLRHQPAKRVHYDDSLHLSDLQESDEEYGDSAADSAAEGNTSKPAALSRDNTSVAPLSNAARQIAVSEERRYERPRTLSEKEIFRRNWAVEHNVMPNQFDLPKDAANSLFPPNDDTISQDVRDLGDILIKVLQSVNEPTTSAEQADILTRFTFLAKKSMKDKQSLAQAFSRLAKNNVIRQSVKRYIDKLGKPEEAEFGTIEDTNEAQWTRERAKLPGPGRGPKPKVPDAPPPMTLSPEVLKGSSEARPYISPYSNPFFNQIVEPAPAAESLNGKGKQAELPANYSTATALAPPTPHAQNALSESQIGNLLAQVSISSPSGNEHADNDALAALTLQDPFCDLEMMAVLQRYIKGANLQQTRAWQREAWAMIPHVTTLADPNRTMTFEQKVWILGMRFEDFAAQYLRPQVNVTMPSDEARALSEVYRYMRNIESGHTFPRPNDYGSYPYVEAETEVEKWRALKVERGCLSKEQLDAIKEDIQKGYDEARAQKEKEKAGPIEEEKEKAGPVEEEKPVEKVWRLGRPKKSEYTVQGR